MAYKRIIASIFALSGMALAQCTTGASGKCEVGSGKTYATIQACANAMANGQTCLVFAGVYAEHPTIPAGASGNVKTITVNGTDSVTVQGFTLGNFDSIIGSFAPRQGIVTSTPATGGFFVTNPSSPTTACITFASNDIVQNNVFYACGTFGLGSNHTNNVLANNTVSYIDSTTTIGAGGTGPFIQMNVGDNFNLIDNNEVSHSSDFLHFTGSHNVVRNNYFHDAPSTDCGTNSGNCHVDYIEAEPGAGNATQFNLAEGNQEVNIVGAGGANGHGFLTQGDGCAGNCFNFIERFNQLVHISGGGIIDDNAGSAVNPGFNHVKAYNETYADMVTATGSRPGGSVDTFSHNSTFPADKNEIYYIVGSVSDFNAYANDGSTLPTFSGGHSLAFCTGSPCTIHSATYGSGTWTSDATNLLTDPLFTGYSSSGLGNLSLQSGSPARNAGANLTTVSGAVANSTTLVVADADYFQDGYTIVQPDCISVSTISNHVCITAINYSTNTLTLSSPITASNGASVWIYSISDGTVVLTDTTAPDIGALPFIPGGTVATPTFSPIAGTYVGSQNVSISSTTPGATILYTVNGTTPTSNSSCVAINGTAITNGSSVAVSVSETLKAIGCLVSNTNSAVASAAYTINAPTLTIIVAGNGTITDNFSNTCTSSTCNFSYPPLSSVTLSSTAGHFNNYSGLCVGQTCTININANGSVVANFNCGPPFYPCSSQSTAVVQTPVPPFSTPLSTGVTCVPGFANGSGNGCYNSIGFDGNLNPVGFNPYLRVTDGTMLSGHSPSSTGSGGDNDEGFNCAFRTDTTPACANPVNGLYILSTTVGGAANAGGIKIIGGSPTVVAPYPPSSSASFHPTPGAASLSFSHTDPTVSYRLVYNGNDPSVYRTVWSWDGIVGHRLTFTDSILYSLGTVCPVPNGTNMGGAQSSPISTDITDTIFSGSLSDVSGIPLGQDTANVTLGSPNVTITGSSLLATNGSYSFAAVKLNGVTYTIDHVTSTTTLVLTTNYAGTTNPAASFQVPSGQGTGHYTFRYDTTKPNCTVVDTYRGTVVCTGTGCPANGNLDNGCNSMYIHDSFMFRDGNYIQISGASTGNNCGNTSLFWAGTTHAVACTGVTTFAGNPSLCGGHNTFGYTNEVAEKISPDQNFYNFNPSTAASTTPFSPFGIPPNTPNTGDCDDHFSSRNATQGDLEPIVGSNANQNFGSSGTTSTWTHPYQNENYAMLKNGTVVRMGHNFILGPPSGSGCGSGVGPFDSTFTAQFAIGVVSQDGRLWEWSSSMLGQLGTDSDSGIRSDIFVQLLDGSTRIVQAPSTVILGSNEKKGESNVN